MSHDVLEDGASGAAAEKAGSKNVPALRFPEFEGEWGEKQLGEVASVTSGGTPSRNNSDYWGGKIPWVTTSEIGQLFIREAIQTLTESGLKNSAAKLFPIGTVLMAMYGQGQTRGRVSVLGIEAATNQACAAILTSKNLFSEFCFYNLARRYEELRDLSNDGSQKNLSGGLIKSLKISLPTLPEQKKIAAFLGVVDAKIAALRARQDGLTLYKKGLMQALFSQSVRFTKPDGTAFPDWEEKRLDEVFSWQKTNSLSRENLNYESGDVQNIHYGDIHTKFAATFRQAKELVPFVSKGAAPNGFSKDDFCKVGDVIIADASEDYADIGKAIEIVELTDIPLVAGLHTYIARPKGELVLGFSGYLLRSEVMRVQIMRIAQGISVLGVSKSNLEKLDLMLPHPDEQQKIADALSAMDAKIAAVAAQVSQMQAFKKGLLQQMFV